MFRKFGAENERASDTAVREAVEELGLEKETIQVLGKHSDVMAGKRKAHRFPFLVRSTYVVPPVVTGTHVTPVIGFLGVDPTLPGVLKPSEAEVASVFTIPLHKLLDPAGRVMEPLPAYKNPTRKLAPGTGDTVLMPAFLAGPEKVWGLTAYILDQILSGVIVPAYNA